MSSDSKPTSSKTQHVPSHGVQNPPHSFWGILRKLGPGMIVAGSIVGSGELIATTATGAKAGFALLWLIVIGCVIKVFVQVEFGRYAIISGKTTMDAFTEVPGPRIKNRGNWLIWYWGIMFIAGIFQLGGIVGGVGQALAISAPWTTYGREYNEHVEAETQLIILHSRIEALADDSNSGSSSEAADDESNQSDSDNETTTQPIFNGKLVTVEIVDRLIRFERQSIEHRSGVFFTQTKPLGSGKAEEENATRVALVERLSEKFDYINDQTPEYRRMFADLLWRLYRLSKIEADLEVAKAQRADAATREEIVEADARLIQVESDYQKWNSSVERAIDNFDQRELAELYQQVRLLGRPDAPIDDKLWAGVIAVITAVLLVIGRFGLIQSFSTAMVASFTVVTVINVIMLQFQPEWAVSISDIVHGLSFRLPPNTGGSGPSALVIALQAFGIIGVGANELICYPYWCLEKGYAQFTGVNDGSEKWYARARGWLRVMHWDAWGSMFIYTFATIAFYLLGAAILGRTGLQPAGQETVRYLAVMYEPVFGAVAQVLFLFGAIAVLYSTYFVANASHARVVADAVRVLGFAADDAWAYQQRVRILSGLFPLLCFIVYMFISRPTLLVLIGGLMQALMLPMLATAALYFRYYRIDALLKPRKAWDVLLWISAIGMLIAGTWAGWETLRDTFGK